MGQANFGIFEDFCGRATDGLSIFSKSLQKSVENLPARGEDKSPKICRCSRKNPHLSQSEDVLAAAWNELKSGDVGAGSSAAGDGAVPVGIAVALFLAAGVALNIDGL